MGMGGGGTGGAVSEINVTPLIDVLLVLLIIFMVIVPVTPHGLDTLIPQPPKTHDDSPPDPNTIVVQIFSTRQNKVMFVKGDPALDFSKVSEVIDFGHQAGVDNIGLITPRVEAGQ